MTKRDPSSRRCETCLCYLPEDAPHSQHYCSDFCRDCARRLRLLQLGHRQNLDINTATHFYCPTCGRKTKRTKHLNARHKHCSRKDCQKLRDRKSRAVTRIAAQDGTTKIRHARGPEKGITLPETFLKDQGLHVAKKGKRVCLKCGKAFLSTDMLFYRCCPICRKANHDKTDNHDLRGELIYG
jgi:hypothetical protein